jgi:hypothetical protein
LVSLAVQLLVRDLEQRPHGPVSPAHRRCAGQVALPRQLALDPALGASVLVGPGEDSPSTVREVAHRSAAYSPGVLQTRHQMVLRLVHTCRGCHAEHDRLDPGEQELKYPRWKSVLASAFLTLSRIEWRCWPRRMQIRPAPVPEPVQRLPRSLRPLQTFRTSRPCFLSLSESRRARQRQSRRDVP